MSFIFVAIFLTTIFLFVRRIRKIINVIKLGKPIKNTLPFYKRFFYTLRFAFGQQSLFDRPLVGILHFIVYVGFIIINIELAEIIFDGIFLKHRSFRTVLGEFYSPLIAIFEYLAAGVLISCIIFFIRRNILRIKRFHLSEMTSYPKSDANIILVLEVFLMSCFLIMNAADYRLSLTENQIYADVKPFFSNVHISVFLGSVFFENIQESSLVFIERFFWWAHIIGIFSFAIYVLYSKHLHILFAFPNIFFSSQEKKGKLFHLETIKKEVSLMLNPNASNDSPPPPEYFGVKDIYDLSRKQLLEAFSCTECGRCTDVCPQNQTGKLLSPRKIVMNVRDRAESIMKSPLVEGDLLSTISKEEIMACNTCNACC